MSEKGLGRMKVERGIMYRIFKVTKNIEARIYFKQGDYSKIVKTELLKVH